ncbi:N-acetylmuramoyl-L-alanine amidase [Salipaludibacillus sp. LMS25]|jgi:N-acetylmuramoyl-L-alanine amidase|uniref:N-acetylmuramoyl-L-alanine amidase n=1 Tax=Salipaludibacillus sp. LMS25 TaxID=2924031 RepID=UPI0020D0C16C|nr:N-acetylmuramoyl-L-alanine amidase [Salipaludibacillus sp. LMS25]UTR14097.1 N-acetylmuramoyl-L-alanine amidase [Salipaludibacillus sp. LMS25]
MTKIFIDPGHGGSDPGAVANGLQEKDVVLDISKRIDSKLNEYSGVKTRLSRTNDTFISLSNRAKMANDWGADYFLSVHINAGGGEGYEDFIFNGNVSSATESNQSLMNKEVVEATGFNNRGKKQANFAVLRLTNMPAILTENGFIDNSNDANKLKNNSFLDKVAEGHVNAIAKMFGLKSESPSNGENAPSKPRSSTPNNSNRSPNKASGTIATIQRTLNSRYRLNISVDNLFGPQTKGTLIKGLQTELNRQFNRGLTVDGIFGPKTRRACVTVRQGARGNITWILQAILHCKGTSPGEIDGIFGAKTRSAVRTFQRQNNLQVDGIAGPQTFHILFK